MKALKVLLAGLAVASVSASAYPACGYDLYRPVTVENIVRQTVAKAGIAMLGNRNLVNGVPSGSVYMMRASQILGTVQFVDDVRTGSSQLTLTDADGKAYFEMRERTYVCPETNPIGRCKLTEITTELDQLSTTPAPFGVLLDPRGYLRFYKYGKEVPAQDWRAQLGETIRWMQGVMTTPRISRAIVATDAESRIFYALASDPVAAPYADRLSMFFDGTYWVVMGRVPSNFVYGRVIDVIRAAGYRWVKPEMTIDTGTALPLPPEIHYEACYW